MVNPRKLASILSNLEQYVRHLRELAQKPRDEFVADRERRR